MTSRVILFTPLFLFMSASIWGNLLHADDRFYIFRDDRGVIHLTNINSDSRFKTVYGSKGKDAKRRKVNLNKIHSIIENVSKKYSLDPALIKAIVKAESDFDPYAVSFAGAKGLMQLMPATADELNVINPFDPLESVEGGTKYFKRLLDLFKNDLELALAAYNAGRSNVLKYGGVPPYKQTKQYLKKVLNYYDHYKRDKNHKI